MDLQELSNLTNDLAVIREQEKHLKDAIDYLLKNNEDYQKLSIALEEKNFEKKKLSDNMMEAMIGEGLKSYKTDYANISISKRKTVSIDPQHKKSIEMRVKAGEDVEGWYMKETEFISIRSAS